MATNLEKAKVFNYISLGLSGLMTYTRISEKRYDKALFPGSLLIINVALLFVLDRVGAPPAVPKSLLQSSEQ